MFEVGFQELVLLFVIGLLVLGPERLPKVATLLGRWVGRARRTASQLRHQLEREIALSDLEERRKTHAAQAPKPTPPATDKPAAPSAPAPPGAPDGAEPPPPAG
jgi:Tat protein translocase TatB subunit